MSEATNVFTAMGILEPGLALEIGGLWFRGAMILLIALSLSRLARTASAATRHAILSAALLVCCLVPIATTVLPTWTVELPWWSAEAIPGDLPVKERVESVVEPAAVSRVPSPLPAAVDSRSRGAVATATKTVELAPVAIRESSSVASSPKGGQFDPLRVALWVWGLGVALRFVGRGRALISRTLLSRRAEPAPEGLFATLNAVRLELGIERPVRLFWTHAIEVPVTWGSLRPVVLLPAAAREWAPQRLRHILLHELSHVRRCDSLVQQFVWLVVTLRWVDPLTWWAAARLKVEAEQACDDRVLLAGGRPAAYAGHLLEIARAARFHGLSAAVAMARSRSSLSGRVEAILDPGRTRRPVGFRRQSLGIAMVALLGAAVATAAVRPGERPATPSAPPKAEEAPEPVTAPEPETPATLASPVVAPEPKLSPAPTVSQLMAPMASEAPVASPRLATHPTAEPVVAPEPYGVLEGVPANLTEPLADSPAEPVAAPLPVAAEPPTESLRLSVPEPLPELLPELLPEPSAAPVVAGGATASSLAALTVPAAAPAPSPSDAYRRTTTRDGSGNGWSHFAEAVERGDCRPSLLARSRSGARIEKEGLDWEIEIFEGTCRLDFEVKGEIQFAEADGQVARLGRSGRLTMNEETRSSERTLVVTAGSGGTPQFEYSIDGSPATAVAGRAWLAEVLPAIYRRTGFRSEERVARMLSRSGVVRVLEELPRLATDYVKRVYAQHLLALSSPTDAELSRLFLILKVIASDYELAEVLVAVEADRLNETVVLGSYLDAARTIDSDYEQGRVLKHPLAASPTMASRRAILATAARLDSDYESAELLVRLVENPGGEAFGEPLYQALAAIGSDFEMRRVLDAAATQPGVARQELVKLIKLSHELQSDYELAEFLVGLARVRALDAEVGEAFLEAILEIESSHQARRAREAYESAC